MWSFLAFAFIGFLFATPAAAQREIARPTPTPAAVRLALVSDAPSAHGPMERNIELQYANLLAEVRDQKSSLEDKIKDIDRQIEALKEQAKKVEQVAERMEQLIPRIDALNKKKAALHVQIAALDAQIVKLEKDRQKKLFDLRAQRAKAVTISPTPAPGPKRP
ncbi:MAG: hypothetical protein KA191_18345 [Verrucomicrobia bacterium]|nr:hypothetical protein [Verrucomicrobiota bacterium]